MKLMYIHGEFTKGNSNGEIEVTNPATEEVLDTVPRGTAEDVESAVRSGVDAFKSWRKMGANERTSLLHEVATKVRSHKEEIVHLLTLEEGKPIPENDEELEWVANTFDYYAELGRHDRGRVIPPGEHSQFNFILKESPECGPATLAAAFHRKALRAVYERPASG
jgi:betaine-aldehyde dehydrogenase